MNKKDVLGARSAAGNVQKMESMPHSIQCRKCSKYNTQQGKGKAGFGIAGIWYHAKIKVKKF